MVYNFPSFGFSNYKKYTPYSNSYFSNNSYGNPFNSASISSNYNYNLKSTSIYSPNNVLKKDSKNINKCNITLNEKTSSQNVNSKNNDLFEFMGIKFYFDDVLLILIIFFLYSENVKDYYLFIVLILLLLS